MKIVIIGDGKVGRKLAAQLSEEDYDIVLIDQNAGKLKEALNQMDIFCITGNGADAEVQKEADVPHADLVIACASTDELNMMSCLLAKRRESVTIFRLIKSIDPNAFVSQSSVIGVYGEGFDQIKVKVPKKMKNEK